MKLRDMGYSQEEFEFVERDDSPFARRWSRQLEQTDELTPKGISSTIFCQINCDLKLFV